MNFVSYIHVAYNYNDVTTHISMRTNFLRHLANIIEWSRPVGGGGGGVGPNYQLLDGQAIQYIYHKYMIDISHIL